MEKIEAIRNFNETYKEGFMTIEEFIAKVQEILSKKIGAGRKKTKKEVSIGHYKKWKKKDIRFLKKNYKKMTQRQIADRLGRSENAIYHKIEDLKL